MIVGGIQPLTMIDYPGKLAAIVFTKGCNFRCPFCHNPELVEPESWEGEEERACFDLLSSRKHMLDGIVVTGGEPTLHKDLPAFIERLKSFGYAVKLDTNGSNPAMVEDLIARGLIDYVAMDLKHTWRAYDTIARVQKGKEYLLDNCRKTVDLLRRSGVPYEWRTTVFPERHVEEDIEGIVSTLLPGEKYYLQEMRYEKTLEKHLKKTKSVPLVPLVERLSASYPEVSIAIR